MNKKVIACFSFLLFSILTYGQRDIEGLKEFGIALKIPVDWQIVEEINQTNNQNLYFLRLSKIINSDERKYMNALLRIDISERPFLKDKMSDNGITAIDTICLNLQQCIRIYGKNIGVIDDSGSGKIFDYSIDWSIPLTDNRYLSIMSNFFSEDNDELKQFEQEVKLIFESIKI